jgi:hypothetical protein
MHWFLLILLLAGLYLLFNHNKWTYDWKCDHCNTIFEISWLTNRISPKRPPNMKLLRCPACHRISWAKEVKRIKNY